MERITVIDFETAVVPYPCQIGITTIVNGEITDSFMRYIKPPKNEYNPYCVEVHGITPEMTINCPEFPEVWDEIKPYFNDCIIAAHNAPFDINVLTSTLDYYGIDFGCEQIQVIDTCMLVGKKSLEEACKEYGVSLTNHHNAFFDSLSCAMLLLSYNETISPKEKKETKKKKSAYHEAITGDVLKKDLSNANPDNPFYDKKVVITGVFTQNRKELALMLKNLGADIDTTITKRTNFVVMGEEAGWKKVETIEKLQGEGYGIKVIRQQELDEILNEWLNK